MKKYRLTALFAATALIAMIIATVMVNSIIEAHASANLIRMAEDEGLRSAKFILQIVRLRTVDQSPPFPPNETASDRYQKDPGRAALKLEDLTGTAGLPALTSLLSQDFNIVQYNLFDLSGRIVWSTDPGRIGSTDIDTPFAEMVSRPISEFKRSKTVVDSRGVRRVMDVTETYIPAQDPSSGRVIGVLEIYRDVTNDVAFLVDDTKSIVLRTTMGTMGGLFLVLAGFVVIADIRTYQANKREITLVETRLAERRRVAEALREQETQRRLAHEKATLAEIARIMGSSLDIRQWHRAFAEEVQKIIPWDRLAIDIVDRERQGVATTVAIGIGTHVRENDAKTQPGSAIREVMQEQSPRLFVADKREEVEQRFPALLPAFEAGLRSFIVVPIASNDQVIAVLHLQSTDSKAYSEQHVHLAGALGYQIGGAITNAVLHAQRKQAEKLILELSIPVLLIEEGLLLVPLIGELDRQRASHMMERVLGAIRSARARVVIVDTTGIATMDSFAARRLMEVIQASKLLGAAVIVTGVSEEASTSLVKIGVDFGAFRTAGDLQRGVEEAKRLLGGKREAKKKL